MSNTAVAAHPEVTYVVATKGPEGTEKLVVAEPLVGKALGEGWETTGQTFTGAEMERWTYQRPFELVEFPEPAHYVVNADYVTTEDGTGLVHQSPAFGEDDLKVCRAYGLPVVNPVRPDGTFEEGLPLVGGVFFKKADEQLTEDLDTRGLLFKHIPYEHSYPHCWRCHTALLYYAQPSWYIRTTAVKDRLLQENEKTNWFPDSVKHGRYGDWLNNNIDWALSRNRYWGHPAAHLALARTTTSRWRAPCAELTERPAPTSPRWTRTARTSTRSPSRARRTGAARPPRAFRRSSTPGTTRARCRSRSGATRTRTRSCSRAGTRRSSSARPSTRPAAGSTR